MKKKLLILMLVLAMVLCVFIACGDEEETPDGTQSGTQSNNNGGSNNSTQSSKPPVVEGGDKDCEHAWKLDSKTEATCSQEGKEISKCTKCSATETKTLPKNSNHKYKVTEELAATCQEFSKTTKVCERCGDEQEVIGTEKASHKGVEKTTLEPTCDADGQRDYLCDVCGEIMYKVGMNKVIPKLGHTYEREGNMFSAEAGVTFVPGNCDTEGYFNRECVDCGFNEDPITRAEYGEMSGDPAFDATKYDDMDVWGHDYSVFVREVLATCTVNGYDEYKCSRCDGTEQRTTSYAEGHLYFKEASAVEGTHFEVTVQPTCCTEGKKAYKCTICGEVATDNDNVDSIPVVSHDTSNRDAQYLDKDVAATCTTDAYKVYRCCVDAFCTETETVTEANTALGHIDVVNGEQTCKTEGKTPYKCGREGCVETWLAGPVNENIRHVALANKVKEATCINNAVYKCSVCDSEFGPYAGDPAYADGIADGKHVYQYSATVAPTCSSIGYNTYVCVRDGACTDSRMNDDATLPADQPKAADVVERTSHTFDENGDGKIDVSPDGKIRCAVCFSQYRDVTTEITNGSGTLCLGCGKTPCDCGLSVEWNGYVSPVIPSNHNLVANTEKVISSVKWTEVEEADKALAIGGGVIILDGAEDTKYTVKIYDKENGTLLDTVEVTGNSIIDLYKYAEVGQVAITASTIAIVFLYATV